MRKIISAIAALVFLCAPLTACTTIGNKFDVSKVDQLQPGSSTMRDAVQLLGPATAQSSLPNNATLLQWQYSQGTLAGGSGAHLAVLFGPDGKMVRITHKFALNN